MSERAPSPIPQGEKPSQPRPPFDAEKGDVILRTSDDVHFRVFKLILSLASPFFKDMFGLPQEAVADEVQVIPIPEDSSIADKLLRFCYPCAAPAIETLDELHAVIEAMMKYQMFDLVGEPQQLLRAFARSHSVAVFAISCRFGWEDVARAAATESLALPLRKFDKKVVMKELKYLTGEQHQALLKYHWHCSAAVTAIVVDLKWLNPDSGWVWFSCQACLPHPSPLAVASRHGLGYGNDTRYVRRWFMDFMERSRAILDDAPRASIRSIALLTPILKQTHGCKNCRELAFEQLLKFLNEILDPKIDEELEKVPLELAC
ncbi:hypothetical protein B0H13DRAFT_233593 [Mycena leptocephala]|nr:hypothetical protein B0H13DRAFT_233593 [Mycena leptocephala]